MIHSVVPQAPSDPTTQFDITLLMENIMGYLSPVALIFGGLLMIFGTYQVIVKVMGPSYRGSWSTSIVTLLTGGMMFGVGLMGTSSKNTDSPPADIKDPSTSTPEVAPPPGPDPETISLPAIENGGTILIALAALVLIPLGIYTWVKISKKMLAERNLAKLTSQKAADTEAKLVASWGLVTTALENTLSQYYEIENDWNMIFNAPAILDPGNSYTSAMLEAMVAAQAIDPSRPDSFILGEDPWASTFGRAVKKFQARFGAAIRNAKRLGTTALPPEERRDIQLIRDLLNIAENHASSPNEREIAYSRAMSLIRKLKSLHLPEKAYLTLEQKFRLAIEAKTPTPSETSEHRIAIAL